MIRRFVYFAAHYVVDDINPPRRYSDKNKQCIITERNAWMRWAFTVDNGLPFTNIVNVSSFSVAIKFPNHDFFVNSGDDSGVMLTSSVDTWKNI